MALQGLSSEYFHRGSFYNRFNYPYYLTEALNFSLIRMRYCPASRWDVDFYAQSMNAYNAITASPYFYSVSIPFGSTRYAVMDPGSYPEHIMAGQRIDYMGIAAQKTAEQIQEGAVNTNLTQISMRLAKIMKLADLLDSQYLSDESKAEVRALINSAKAKETSVKNIMKDTNGITASKLNAKLLTILDSVKEMVAEAEEKGPVWMEEALQAQEEETERLQDELEDELDDGDEGGSDAPRTVVASGTAQGKKVDTLSSDDELKDVKQRRYGMNPTASVPACENASELVDKAVADDMTTKDKFAELFGKDKDINEKNIIEVLDSMNDKGAFVDKIAALKDGDNDYSEKALKEIVKLLKARVKLLDDAVHLEVTDKNLVNAHINNLLQYASNVKTNKTTIVDTLDTIVNTLKNKGTESVVTTAIEAKQAEAKVQAQKEFRQAYAKDSEKEYDAEKTYASFPAEITYLPNKKLYQVTIKVGTGSDEKTHYFEAGNFKNLNKVIVDSGLEDVITKWNEIKGNLLKEKEAEPTV